jgi:hypothetical protein
MVVEWNELVITGGSIEWRYGSVQSFAVTWPDGTAPIAAAWGGQMFVAPYTAGSSNT